MENEEIIKIENKINNITNNNFIFYISLIISNIF